MKSTPNRPGPPNRPGATGRPPATTRPAAPTQRAANAAATQAYLRGVIAEMRRVTWPSREEWVAATILTIVLVVGVGFFTYGVDLVLSFVFSKLTGGAR